MKTGLSARHQIARRFTDLTNSIAFAAGRYGTVTLYHLNKELICTDERHVVYPGKKQIKCIV